jgi:hypothetical protein
MTRSDEQLAYYVAQAREIIDLSLMSQRQIVDDLQQLPGPPGGGPARAMSLSHGRRRRRPRTRARLGRVRRPDVGLLGAFVLILVGRARRAARAGEQRSKAEVQKRQANSSAAKALEKGAGRAAGQRAA